ncbi:MAG: PAS domain-containing sensor histidine kinase [Ardenticatenaceae bacterium]|nr:PAS domain-containing sensor histidine kinase [Ardenticatenaceae bacterium]MCB8973589.1 PAS domain-containing sensor histidine kinase [Ardenticatenaceae bacterium]
MKKMIKENLILETQFAPAARASLATLEGQSRKIGSIKHVASMFSTVPNPVVILNQERQIIFANPAFKALIKVPEMDRIVGMRPGEAINCIHAFETSGGCGTTEFCSQCGAVQAILAAQKGAADVKECRIMTEVENEIVSLDLRVWATPYAFEDEQFTVFSVADISNEKRRRVLERIFFHDVINTAGAIQGLVDMYLTIDDPAELRVMGIDTMLSQASHQLIDEIQAQSQLMAAESGELTVKPTQFESCILLRQLLDVYQNHIVAEGKKIRLNTAAHNVSIQSDRALMGRVIGNMIKNALEASASGDVVTVGCEHFFDYVRFWVHNEKVMPKHIKLQVFQRSFSTKGEGRGLGTYSMKLLTENYLQGRISFESEPEKGTTFMATYPVEWLMLKTQEE